MKRRKDNKGKVLKEGESQRKDGLYQYRWTDKFGKRHSVYAGSLKELREKEKDILINVALNKNLNGSKTSVINLVETYCSIREHAWKKGTKKERNRYLRLLSQLEFGQRIISDINYSDALLWTKELYESGYCFGTVNSVLSLIRPAFDLACREKNIDCNPFSFNLSEIVGKPHSEKSVIKTEDYNSLIEFIKTSKSKVYIKRLDEIMILYETGIRASELCGLTFNDVDLQNKRIKITHQLQWDYENKYYIDTPKSERGNRIIPLSPIAVKCFENVIANRKQLKNEPMVDGYVGFLFLTNRGSPQMVKHVDQHLDTIINGYNACHEGKELHITPHTFRHTFCSRMIQSGMDIKSVQYLMGHATAQITLDVYSHVMQESNIDDFFKKTS